LRCLPVIALGDPTIHGDTSISETFEVLFGASRPFGSENGTLGLVGQVIANSELLANTTLEINVGPSVTAVFLHGDDVDVETTVAEFLLEVGVGGGGDSLDKHLHGVLEIIQVLLVRCGLEESPGFVGRLVSNVVKVDDFSVSAFKSLVTLLQAVLAKLGL
jgi:hypothetical protein